VSSPELDPGSVRQVLAAADNDPGELQAIRLQGGASREVYRLQSPKGRWVLRRDPPGSQSFAPLSLEHRLMGVVHAAGVPVPAPLAYRDEGGAFGTAGFLMEHIEGESLPPRLLGREEFERARAALPAQLGRVLAGIHALDPDPIEGLLGTGGDPALDACALWEAELDRLGLPLPAVEAGLRWLRLNAPERPERIAVVHGDFRLGNFIVNREGLAAVIDWELAHAGDPAEDIGWLMIRSWRFGRDQLPVAGLGRIEQLRDAYLGAGGRWPDPETLLWWEAMGNVKWAVICARQAAEHLSGLRPSHELASLGRRICEPEWDLLQLIGAPR